MSTCRSAIGPAPGNSYAQQGEPHAHCTHRAAPVLPAAVVGFATGALASTIVSADLDRARRRHLRALLQCRAVALANALDALAADVGLDEHHVRAVTGLRDRAVALADAAKGAWGW